MGWRWRCIRSQAQRLFLQAEQEGEKTGTAVRTFHKGCGRQIIVLDELTLSEVKTKEMVKVLGNIKCDNALIVMDGSNENVMLSARNIPTVKTASVNTINVYDLLKYNNLVVTKEAVEKIQEVYA